MLGVFLETLHGFKAGFYLDASSATRRLMWTLAHAHGTLLSLVHLALAAFLNAALDWPDGPRTIASRGDIDLTVPLRQIPWYQTL